tara:strand:+ start:1705 stop:2070 length:366 start_codon:yes stop_codon:yes gene_type:complete
MDYIVYINILVSLSILNVWLLRFNNQTPYRGGDSNTLKEEFHVYGLPKWFMYLVGTTKVILAILLIVGIWKKHINIYVVSSMIVLMLGALLMHYKVSDPIKKSLPAFTILLFLVFILINNV